MNSRDSRLRFACPEKALDSRESLCFSYHQELDLVQQLPVVGVADLNETVALGDLVHLLLDALQHLLVAAQLVLDIVHLGQRLVQQLHQHVNLLL